MRSVVLVALLVSVISWGPLAGAEAPCDPEAHPERVSLDGVGVRVLVGEDAFYVVSRNARTIGQSDLEVWEETNGVPGLQTWAGECGQPADRYLAGGCVWRGGSIDQLECPRASTGDLGAFLADRV